MKKITDVIIDVLAKNGIKHCFTLVGGGAMHLNDAFGHSDRIECVYFLHEQSAAIAAEAYARVDNQMPVVCVTTGPGGTNALTGVLCAWLDNIPMLVISGQVKRSAMVCSTGLSLRQFGEQEFDIVTSVRNMTKYAETVKDPREVKYILQKAIHIANTGRRGPCWVDIPLDIQGMSIDESQLHDYVGEDPEYIFDDGLVEIINNSRKPLVLAGSGIRSGDAYKEFLHFSQNFGLPIVMAKSVADILPMNDANCYGNFGINGGRAGNFLVQNADLLISLGCRLSFGQIGFNYELFSPNSKKIVIEIDSEELKKETVHIDYPVNADLKSFLSWINKKAIHPQYDQSWLKYAEELKKKYPIYQSKFERSANVNPYYFAKILFDNLNKDGICVCGNSCSAVAVKQYGVINENQRMWGNINCGTMGYDLPAAIGARIASQKQVVCCAGDGSFQLNVQELQTLITYNLPIKIFVFNNGGYNSIILSQNRNFNRLAGCTEESGLRLPNLRKIAEAWDLKYYTCSSNKELQTTVSDVLNEEGAVLCEIIEDKLSKIEPKLGNKVMPDGKIVSPSLADLEPLLAEDEFLCYSNFDAYRKKNN